MKRGYGNDKIYRIIGGVTCERKGEHFVCKTGLRRTASRKAEPTKDQAHG